MANLQKNNKSRVTGFSLVEMAIVLGIVGLIGAGTGLMYSEQKNQAEWQESQAKLKVVKSAILKFAEVNKYMPCPDNAASPTGSGARTGTTGTVPAIAYEPAVSAISATSHSPAIPAIKEVVAQSAISGVSVNVCSVDKGTVPYQSLGLSKADVEDSFGNPFIYAVDQGVTNASDMLNCPSNTACFFNNMPQSALIPAGRTYLALPAYDTTTQPLKGVLGANNLEICNDSACSSVQSDGLVAVLLAKNDDGSSAPSISAGETQNNAGGQIYVNQTYSKNPFYDDVVLGISAYEIQNSNPSRVVENSVAATTPSAPVTQTGNDVGNLGDMTTGAVGTNLGTDDGILDQASQTFDFGADKAGEKVVLTFDTHAVGAWNKAATTNSNVFDDRGSISANGDVLREFDYDHLVDPRDGLEQVTFESAVNGRYSDTYNSDGSWDSREFSKGESIVTWQPYWNESHEYIVTLDENGQAKVDFEVETTATVETIDFSNIELVYYDTPPDMPSFPEVNPISGVSQSEGLN
ncbi:hypothetical protein JCM30760_20440 [Thiomicrorhabdus hydrogeniphila]